MSPNQSIHMRCIIILLSMSCISSFSILWHHYGCRLLHWKDGKNSWMTDIPTFFVSAALYNKFMCETNCCFWGVNSGHLGYVVKLSGDFWQLLDYTPPILFFSKFKKPRKSFIWAVLLWAKTMKYYFKYYGFVPFLSICYERRT